MAYLSFSPLDGETKVVTPAPTALDAGCFSTTELRVIEFAQRVDATREMPPHSRLGRLMEWAFGTRLSRPLADPRLESLRRFVSLARHHARAVGRADIEMLVAAGYSEGQALGLLAYLTGGRRSHRRILH